MVALRCCVSFCCTSESAVVYIYICSLLSLPPTLHAIPLEHCTELPVLYSSLPLAIYFAHVCVSCSVMSNSATPWTIASQTPLSTEFSRQESWSGLPFPSPGGSSRPGDQTWVSCIAGRFFIIWAAWEAPFYTWPLNSSYPLLHLPPHSGTHPWTGRSPDTLL